MKIVATCCARMGSSRLPGKSLMPLAGKPLVQRILERVAESRLIDTVVLATSTEAKDDPLEALARGMGLACHRGSEDDVLGRVVGALMAHEADIHVEFMGDNLLPDPLLIDSFIGYFLKHAEELDYLTNALTTTYPPGAEVTVHWAEALYRAEREATDMAAREHVGPHIYQRKDRYRVKNLEAPAWLRAPDLHLEVDTAEDYEVVKALYEHFLPQEPFFSLSQAIAFMRANPDIAARNKDVARRWREYRQD